MKKGSILEQIQGFTLIELLVVIAIIGILASVIWVSLNTAHSKSRDARVKSDIRNLMTAVELYKNDHDDQTPGSLQDLVDDGFIKKLPDYPKEGGQYTYSANAEGNYVICHSGQALESGKDKDKYFYAQDGVTSVDDVCPTP